MELKNKRVLVVGLGKSGVAAAFFLADRGAKVAVSDAKSEAQLEKQIPALLDRGISLETGTHNERTFRDQDLIVVSPGVPSDQPQLQHARALGIPVIGEVELAYQFLQGKVIAITGSNGKTTTTTLVGEILSKSGKKTLVGGNIGTPVISLVDKSSPDHLLVLEISSFQLETIEQFRPWIAVVLNITPDHLDRHGSFENYTAMKARITENQQADDFLVLNAEDKPTQMVAAKTKAQIFWFSPRRPIKRGAFVHGESIVFVPSEGAKAEPIMPVAEIPLKGSHNVENVLAAVCAARLAGAPAEKIRASVAGFKAVEHRLEFVRCVQGVEYFNDSKATNVDAAMKAVASFPGGIHLILGGKDKDSDYTLLSSLLKERVKAIYTIGSAAEKIERELHGVVKMVGAGTLDLALSEARNAAVPGDIVLLAPACSSFDQFENYEHRGRTFRK